MGELHVLVASVSTVYPASPSQTKNLLLNPIDQWMKLIEYHKRVLFFKTDDDTGTLSNLADRLKASLSETLVHFYPFAGRVRVRDDDDGRLELVSNGEGVQFVEATTHAKLDDIQEFQPSPCFSDLAQTPGYNLVYPWKLDYPLLFVQVTSFQQGGFSVGVTFSHQIADGTSFWQFIRSWAEVARGKPISTYPYYMYGSLHIMQPRALGGSKDDLIGSLYKLVDAKEPMFFGSSVLESKLFQFSAKAVFDLKLLAGESSKGRAFTTFEVVCAHIWQCGVIARELEDNQESKLLIATNLRGRISSYPRDYFGNAAIFTAATTPAGALKAASLSDVANLIQRASADFTEQRIHALLGFLSDNTFHMKEKRPRLQIEFASDMVVRSSPRLRMYDTDFGWGRPIAVTFDIKSNHDGAVLLDGGREEGSLDVTLSLPAKVMGRLLRDQAFFPNKRSDQLR